LRPEQSFQTFFHLFDEPAPSQGPTVSLVPLEALEGLFVYRYQKLPPIADHIGQSPTISAKVEVVTKGSVASVKRERALLQG